MKKITIVIGLVASSSDYHDVKLRKFEFDGDEVSLTEKVRGEMLSFKTNEGLTDYEARVVFVGEASEPSFNETCKRAFGAVRAAAHDTKFTVCVEEE